MILAADTCITRYAMLQAVIQNEGNFGEFKLRAHEAYSPTLFYSNGCFLCVQSDATFFSYSDPS
jgi:hypothetical protein